MKVNIDKYLNLDDKIVIVKKQKITTPSKRTAQSDYVVGKDKKRKTTPKK